ncbi:MAG: FAD-dependent oxidoreductase [Pseudomonadota bacterium]
MATVEITVRGAGIAGLSVAWACARRGARVHVIDPGGVAAGASGGIVGALAPHVPEQWNPKKAFQLESLLMAEDWWTAIEEVGGRSSGYARTGRIQPVVPGGEALAYARARGAKTLWQGRAEWEVTETAPAFAPTSESGLWIKDTLSAHIHPRQACNALAAAICAMGGNLTEDAETPDEGVVVEAMGAAGLDALTAQHHRLVGTGIKGQAVLLRHDAAGQPQLFADGLHIIPHLDGTTAIGSTTEREFEDPNTTDAQCDELIKKARALVPALADAPEITRWAGLRPRARTRAPMLGRHPFRDGAFIANGGFKIGFGMAPLCAEKLADLILEERDTIPDDFRPEASI